jgi:hypothetical protein
VVKEEGRERGRKENPAELIDRRRRRHENGIYRRRGEPAPGGCGLDWRDAGIWEWSEYSGLGYEGGLSFFFFLGRVGVSSGWSLELERTG